VFFPTVVGLPPKKGDEYHIGDAALVRRRRLNLTLSYPVKKGIVTNWDDMEKIWHNIFESGLEVSPEDHHVLLADSPLNTAENRAKMQEIMFEALNVPGLYIANQAALTVYSDGRGFGTVVDIGDDVCNIVPVHQGEVITAGVKSFPVTGSDLTDYFVKSLVDRGYSYTSPAERMVVCDIKETLGYVAQNYEHEKSNASSAEKTYEFPDGEVITVGIERFRTPEAFFQPTLIGRESVGLPQAIRHAVGECGVLEADLSKHIVLSGGSTLFPGFADRLKKEIDELSPVSVRVSAPTYRKNHVFFGASMLAMGSGFTDLCNSRAEYDEFGSTHPFKKFPTAYLS